MLLELRSKSKFFLVLPLSFILKGTVGVENEAEKWAPLVPSGLTEVVLRTLPSLLRRSRLSDVSRILSLALTIKMVWADFPVVSETTRVLLGFVACVTGLQKGKKERKIKARSAIERNFKKGTPASTPLVLSFRPQIKCANPRKPWNAWVSESRRFAARKWQNKKTFYRKRFNGWKGKKWSPVKKNNCYVMCRICQVNLKLTYDATKTCLNLFK